MYISVIWKKIHLPLGLTITTIDNPGTSFDMVKVNPSFNSNSGGLVV